MHNYNVNTYLLPRKLALPPWEGQGEVTQVSTPLLGRGWGRLRRLVLPSLGGVGGGYAS